MKNIFFSIILVFMYCNSFAQPNQDARMLGLNGAYTTLVNGYQCVGVNPANLGAYMNKSMNIFNVAFGLSTNSLSIANYNVLNGANMEDPNSINYYPKSDFYDTFSGRGIRLLQSYKIPLSVLNFSTQHFAFTTNLNNNVDVGVPNGFIELMLYGNPISREIAIDMEQFISITQDFGFSYGHSFDRFSTGFTLKYLLGIFYMGMESIDQPEIVTEITGFTGQNQYLIQQAIGGSGTGLDLGIITKESDSGYRYGMSIINLLGTVKWTQDNFLREQLEPSLSGSSFYLRPNEFMYVNMVMDSVTGLSFSETSGDPLIYYEMYKVMPLQTIDTLNISTQDSMLLVSLSDDTYLYPSGGDYKRNVIIPSSDTLFTVVDNYTALSLGGDNPFVTRQPIYLRMGFSRRWEGQAVLAADLVTGFSDRFDSSSSWKLAIGTEIIRFNNKFLRLGYAFGGLTKRSMSLGYGQKIGNLFWDFGISFNGGYTLETAKGIDIAFGLIWKKN